MLHLKHEAIKVIRKIFSLVKYLVLAPGVIILLSGFDSTRVQFSGPDVQASPFKIRMAKKKGLPVPEPVPGPVATGVLTKPDGGGPFPALVLFPSGGGWRDTPEHWIARLNAWGYTTLKVDMEVSPAEQMEPVNQVLKAIGAYQYLIQQPYVDSRHIGIMGWSLGAETALWAIDESSWAGRNEARFDATVAIYPACGATGKFFSPSLIILAELDDAAQPVNCHEMAKRVPAGSTSPEIEVMPNAYHWFDLPRKPVKTYRATYEYNPEATETAVDLVRSFLKQNL